MVGVPLDTIKFFIEAFHVSRFRLQGCQPIAPEADRLSRNVALGCFVVKPLAGC